MKAIGIGEFDFFLLFTFFTVAVYSAIQMINSDVSILLKKTKTNQKKTPHHGMRQNAKSLNTKKQ